MVGKKMMMVEGGEAPAEEEKIPPIHAVGPAGALENDFSMNLSWESSNHFTIVFIEDGSSIFIYKDPNQVPIDIRKLIYVQSNFNEDSQIVEAKLKTNRFNIEDLSKLSDIELQKKLKIFRTRSKSKDI